MMERTLVQDAKMKVGECIALRGFVHAVRNQKSVQFIVLRDPTGLIQIVAERSDANKDFNELIAVDTTTQELVWRRSAHFLKKKTSFIETPRIVL